MLNDPRKMLLTNRIGIMKANPQLTTPNFPTHVHMAWPTFYDSFAQMTPEDANVLLFSHHTYYANDGVLLNIEAIMSSNNLLSDLEVSNGSSSIH